MANHTSPIDIIILGCDNVYAMVSGGLFVLSSVGTVVFRQPFHVIESCLVYTYPIGRCKRIRMAHVFCDISLLPKVISLSKQEIL